MLQNIRHNRAFTIIEVLTAVFLVGILIGVLSTVFNLGIRAYRQADEIIEITNRAQRFLGQITAELSGAIISDNPPISFQGNASSIYFMAPRENASDLDLCEIGYNLVGTEIKRLFVTSDADTGFEYPNNPVNYDPNDEAFYIDLGTNGGLTFNYTDTNGIGLPELVEIIVTMQDSREKTYTFSTKVFLANSTND